MYLLNIAYRQVVAYVKFRNRALYFYFEAVWLSVSSNIIPDAISRLRYPNMQRWFLTLVGLDMSNIYSMYMALWGHVSNKAFISIFNRDGQ